LRGFKSPQSLAGARCGGVLRNTGITFESDGMTAYRRSTPKRTTPTRCAGAGVPFDLARQIVGKGPVVQRRGDNTLGNQTGIECAISSQSARTDHRFDAMKGFLQGQKDIYGVRAELA